MVTKMSVYITYDLEPYRVLLLSLSVSSLSRGEAMELLRRWFVESKGTVNVSTVVYMLTDMGFCRHRREHNPILVIHHQLNHMHNQYRPTDS